MSRVLLVIGVAMCSGVLGFALAALLIAGRSEDD